MYTLAIKYLLLSSRKLLLTSGLMQHKARRTLESHQPAAALALHCHMVSRSTDDIRPPREATVFHMADLSALTSVEREENSCHWGQLSQLLDCDN